MGNKLKKVVLGEITVQDKVRVSDPMYDINTWCAGTIENMRPGTYECFTELSDEGKWGIRVAKLSIRHKESTRKIARIVTDIDVGVDSGLCGIYDLDFFKKVSDRENEKKREEWFNKIYCSCNGEGRGETIDELCVISSSGYGDGGYNCYIGKDKNGQVEMITIRYI